jgi:thioredoxin-dependent peroxiredoxin
MYRLETGLSVGDVAPDFYLKDTTGKTVKLSDFRGKVNVLLAFYRGESDLYSINWLKKLDDDYLEIRALNAEVIGISSDKENEEAFMKDKYSIPFRLLPDPGNNVVRLYRVYDDFTHTATCAAFVVDRSGKIRYKYVSGAPPDLPDNGAILATLRYLV